MFALLCGASQPIQPRGTNALSKHTIMYAECCLWRKGLKKEIERQKTANKIKLLLYINLYFGNVLEILEAVMPC